MEKKGFWKTLLGLGGTGVLVAAFTLGTLEQKVERVEQTTNQAKVEFIQKNISIDEYRSRTSPEVIFVEQKVQEYLDGLDLTKIERKAAWNNLINGYRDSTNNTSRFENDIQILNDFVTKVNWYEFSNSQGEIKRRYTQIITSLQNSIDELKLVRDVVLPTNLKQNKDHSIDLKFVSTKETPNNPGLSPVRSNDLKRKIQINRESLQQSYKLLEWYAKVLILKTEIWNLRNPGDSLATQEQHTTFLASIKTLKFDPNKF
jgi:hypothetical protein